MKTLCSTGYIEKNKRKPRKLPRSLWRGCFHFPVLALGPSVQSMPACIGVQVRGKENQQTGQETVFGGFPQPNAKWLGETYQSTFGREGDTFSGSRLAPSWETCKAMPAPSFMQRKAKAVSTASPNHLSPPLLGRPSQKPHTCRS